MKKSKRQEIQAKREKKAALKSHYRKLVRERVEEQELKAQESLRKNKLTQKVKKKTAQPLRSLDRKAYRKQRAEQNRLQKERQKQIQELLSKQSVLLAQQSKKIKSGKPFLWYNLPHNLSGTVDECGQLPKKYRNYFKEALQHAKKYHHSLTGLMSINFDTELYEELGQLQGFKEEMLLWHGTKIQNLHGIFTKGFKLPKWSGMLGRGIYLAPAFAKSWNFTGWSSKEKTILLCSVRPGKIIRPNLCQKQAEQTVLECGGHTAFIGSGKTKYAYRGWLQWSEYCVYDPIQVVPRLLFVFEKEQDLMERFLNERKMV